MTFDAVVEELVSALDTLGIRLEGGERAGRAVRGRDAGTKGVTDSGALGW